MNNSNPFVPQGSLLEQKNKKRARVKYAVYSIFAVNILLITPLLIQGCKKEPEPDTTLVDANTNTPPDTGTNLPIPALSNAPTAMSSNAAPQQAVPQAVQQPIAQPVTEQPAAASEYVIAKGDSYYTIAKKYNVKMKDLEAANPGIPATKMKVGQKLQIPAGGSASAGVSGPAASGVGMEATEGNSAETYTVKAGDSLTKIAKHFGVSVKAVRHANKLTTDRITVGKKLKIPAKAAMAAPATESAAPVSAPAPMQTAPAPAGNPQQQ